MLTGYVFYSFVFFFFNDTATTEIYTLSLHDALPILPGEPGLHRDELPARVPLVRHEEQPRRQPAEPVRPVHEVVPAPQQPGAAVLARVGEPHVRVDGDGGLPVGTRLRQVRLVELGPLAQRRAD